MVNVRGVGRLGMLAVGLGIGVAVAHSPVASADSSTDWLSSIDSLLGGAVPALSTTTSDLNLAISFDGYSLVSDGSASATTVSGEYGLAIAYGDGAYAYADNGTGNFALADGTNAGAYAGGAGIASGNNFDTAIDIGNNSSDTDISDAYDGSYNSAVQIGNNTGTLDGVYAGDGSYNSAIQIGSNTGNADGVDAGFGSHNTAVDIGSFNGDDSYTLAGEGNDNLAEAVGNQSHSYAGGVVTALYSNDNVAYVLDPTGTDGSFAEAGGTTTAAGGYDLAAVLGVDDTTASATGAQFLYDIVTALGNESGTAASTGGGLLGELAGLF
jgi:hypothetical protein